MIAAPTPEVCERTSTVPQGSFRVLHLSAGNLYGGIERVLSVLAQERALTPRMTPLFGVCFGGRLYDELVASRVPVFELGAVRIRRPWSAMRARRALRRLVAEHHVDVVVTHGLWSHAVFGPAVGRTTASLVHWAHGPFDAGRWLDRLGTWTTPNLVLANSRFTAESFATAFLGVQREVVGLPSRLHGPVDAGTRNQVRRSLGAAADAIVIVMVSRIEALKGHEVLLKALEKVRRDRAVECWIVGGAQRESERQLLESLKHEAVKIGPWVKFLGERSDIVELLTASDVYCQPNTRPEAFGLSFIEALDAGLPVVTSRIGGATEFLDESCAILTPPGDVDAVAGALNQLIENDELRRTLGRNGPERARVVCDPSERLAALERAIESVRKAERWSS